MSFGPCRLCGVDRNLQRSHIIPAFVFRWLKESSGGNPIRNSKSPNVRIQDGLKLYWLCAQCEKRISVWEKAFAEKLFTPYLANPSGRFKYTKWLNRFCISVSWRAIRYAIELNQFTGWTAEAVARIKDAEATWRSCLLEQLKHPGEFEQHLIPFERISRTTGTLDTSINRYLTRDVDLDICHTSKLAFTYAKLGRFAIIGFVQGRKLSSWRGTKVHATEGIVGPRQYVLPMALMDYLNSRSRIGREALESVSKRQRKSIDDAVRKNIDSFVGSDAFAALQADIELFRDAAFHSPAGDKNAR